MIQKPTALGLILCEQLIVEENTHNLTPVNCFRRRKVASFPSEPLPFILLVLLTDGLGTMDLELIIQRLDDEEVVYRRIRRYQFADPLQEVRECFEFDIVRFRAPEFMKCRYSRMASRWGVGGYILKLNRRLEMIDNPDPDHDDTRSEPSGFDSHDCAIFFDDGPSDITTRPCPPALRHLLAAEREKIARWKKQARMSEPPEQGNGIGRTPDAPTPS